MCGGDDGVFDVVYGVRVIRVVDVCVGSVGGRRRRSGDDKVDVE